MIGTKLGSYEISAKLGEGGMGVVFQAKDSQLGREVALKVLPEGLTDDPERLARFEREAKLLAQLNHPNIAQIHGLEIQGDTRALVMELVEGPTLAERLESGSLPLEESLSIARQIAEALEEAHEKGIIHRDLKPQNIKASIEGRVKVLDFGLAKAMDPTGAASGAASASQLAASPTLTLGATVQGVILGTASYMSPEQAKGLAVDKRADIWAFGVVLYEMLTGKRLFDGDTVPEVLAGVIKNEIDVGALPAEVPPAIRRLVRRCLERNPKNRLHDIADARLVIEDALAGRADEAAAPAAAPTPTASSWPTRLGWLAAGVALGTAAWFGLRSAGPSRPAESAPGSFALRRLTELPGAELHPSLSPDGRMIVYSSAAAGNLDLYLLRVGGDRAIPLTTDPADDSRAAFSPDGEQIAFRSERDGGGLFVMGATGESVRRITDAGFDPSWSPDGKRLAYASEWVVDPVSRDETSELWIVDVESGKRERRLAGDAVQPAWSPRGDRIAYWANTDGQRDLWTVAVDAGEPVAVTADAATDWSPEWSPDGLWLYFASDRGGSYNLWRLPIGPATGAAAGAPQPVTTGVRGMAYARFSRDGSRLSAMAYERSFEQSIYELDLGATRARPLRTLRNPSARWCSLSPDGADLACNSATAPEDLLVVRTDGSAIRRLTSDFHKDRTAIWDPSGERLVFYSTRSGRWQFWIVNADGSDLRQLTELPMDLSIAAWLPGGRNLVAQTASYELFRLDPSRIETATTATALPSPPASERFSLHSWSASGELGLGTSIGTAGRIERLAIWTSAGGSPRRFDVPVSGRAFGAVGGWLPGDRAFVARTAEGVAVTDAESGRYRVIAPAGRDAFVSLSRDGRTLSVENEILDSDVWLLEFEGGFR